MLPVQCYRPNAAQRINPLLDAFFIASLLPGACQRALRLPP